MNYEVTKEVSAKKVKDTIKADISNLFLEFLEERFGTAATVRTTGTDPKRGKNEIAFCIGTIEEEGIVYPAYVTIAPTVKEWKTRPYGKGERKAFDFEKARNVYNEKLTKNGSEGD